jgi:hypothetical protein
MKLRIMKKQQGSNKKASPVHPALKSPKTFEHPQRVSIFKNSKGLHPMNFERHNSDLHSSSTDYHHLGASLTPNYPKIDQLKLKESPLKKVMAPL